jgi:Na+-driven multidrug efflux pump
MTQAVASKNYKQAKKYFIYLTSASCLIGTYIAIIFYSFPNELLNLFYGSTSGSEFVKFLASLLYYFI